MRISFHKILLLQAVFVFNTACGVSNTEQRQGEPNGSEPKKDRFEDEIPPAASSVCFPGAYYRKAVSSTDYWVGIEGTVILPIVHLDTTRVNDSRLGRFLDNSSVYLGGRSDGQETDIGMAWEVVKDEKGNVSKEKKAFRPILRRSAHSRSGQASVFKNAPAESRYYWYPGDTVTMRLEVIGDGKLKFSVKGTGKYFEDIFEANGYKQGTKAEYKRVNAIDQAGNEGKPVQPTTARFLDSKWTEVYLLRSCNSTVMKASMNKDRFTDMRCPDAKHFDVTVYGDGSSESISIYGTRE